MDLVRTPATANIRGRGHPRYRGGHRHRGAARSAAGKTCRLGQQDDGAVGDLRSSGRLAAPSGGRLQVAPRPTTGR
jgi:hypothetical protein